MKLIIFVAFVASICYTSAIPACADPNEVYNCCGSACQQTCDNLLINVLCIAECTPGCFCRDGYVRKYENGPCVLLENCPCTTTMAPPPPCATSDCSAGNAV